LMPEQALKLMSNFKADESFILNPGDVLYLPPEIAHYGIASSDDCVTCSVGVRLPSHGELLTSFVDNIAQKQSENYRLEEPSFIDQPNTGEITNADLNNISKILTDKLHISNYSIMDWFGTYITEYRSLFYEFNQEQNIIDLENDINLIPSPFSKTCYFNNHDETANLFVNGQKFISSIKFAQILCDKKIISHQDQVNLVTSDKLILQNLYQQSALINTK